MQNVDRCVVCGEIIPEGRQVCQCCEGQKTNGWMLLLCPFCGGIPKLEDMGYPHHVFCTECGARVTGRGYGEEGEADAIKKWNARA